MATRYNISIYSNRTVSYSNGEVEELLKWLHPKKKKTIKRNCLTWAIEPTPFNEV